MVEIITIGDELLIGQVVDTNSAWMSAQLDRVSMPVDRIVSIHDSSADIKQAVNEAINRSDVVLLTGGLGPTKDDITKTTLCELFNTQLVHSQEVENNILRLWYQRNKQVLNPLTATQALVPGNCEVIQNEVGTAPIMLWQWTDKQTNQKHILVSMPGVPFEMQYAMTNHIIPRLQNEYPDITKVYHRTVIVEGVPESALAIQLEQWETALPDYMHLAYLPKQGVVRLRLDAVDKNHSGDRAINQELDTQIEMLSAIVGKNITSYNDEPLEVTLGTLLRRYGYTIATAESCTGGTIASLLAKHAGSSDFYIGSVVSYANSVKEHVLGVNSADLQQYGAVSEPVVRQMAEGVKRLLNTDWAIATSGIAGPSGGTADKPVGTIWIAISGPKNTITECLHLGTLREQNILRTTQIAISTIIKQIL